MKVSLFKNLFIVSANLTKLKGSTNETIKIPFFQQNVIYFGVWNNDIGKNIFFRGLGLLFVLISQKYATTENVEEKNTCFNTFVFVCQVKCMYKFSLVANFLFLQSGYKGQLK